MSLSLFSSRNGPGDELCFRKPPYRRSRRATHCVPLRAGGRSSNNRSFALLLLLLQPLPPLPLLPLLPPQPPLLLLLLLLTFFSSRNGPGDELCFRNPPYRRL